jgi:transcriptional regulator with XRE-family HTH domain
MYWNFGSVYKQLRKDKHLSQNYVCKGTISRSNLSRIEAENQVTSVDTMEQLLEKINVSFDEFKYLCNKQEPSKREQIIQDFVKIDWNGDVEGFEKLALSCESYLKNEHDEKIQEILNIVLAMQGVFEDGISDKSRLIANVVWKRLSKIDVFTIDDLKTLNQVLFAFKPEQLDSILPQIKATLIRYHDYNPIAPIKLNLLTNTAYLKMLSNDFYTAKDLLEQALSLAKNKKYYDFLAFIWVRLGICTKDRALIEKGRTLIIAAEEPGMLVVIEQEIEKFSYVFDSKEISI